MYEEYELICILGPTASGKTRYAVELAGRIDGEILSGDSRQVYRGMDIGTGKDLEEYGSVPYHLIDIADAGTKYNIYQYQKDFSEAFHDIVSRGKRPVLCGGSGLYIEAVTSGYHLPDVPANEALRKELAALPMDELIARYEKLRKPHNKTDYDTKQRLIRALEIALYENEHPVQYSSYLPQKTKFIGINVSREERNARIDARLERRLESGMVEEVRGLLESGIPAEDLIYYGLEYKYITLYLTGEMSYATMVERLRIAIHQFAKRQMTWFRGMERRGIRIEWI
ncbi:MAG: tRNA (adenosine(37)-N6)-dimethylallyltransferase MiaA [Bacteroidales bacterium]|nr:tRNA (adenosine(37)-N6)-dimethylallyltransferase MiaA [Candidatus Cacconaster equifaecalis]